MSDITATTYSSNAALLHVIIRSEPSGQRVELETHRRKLPRSEFGYNYSNMWYDLKTSERAYKTIWLKQKLTGETGTKPRLGRDKVYDNSR